MSAAAFCALLALHDVSASAAGRAWSTLCAVQAEVARLLEEEG